MTYRSLSQTSTPTPTPKVKRSKQPRGYFKKEESTYLTYAHHHAMRLALDFLWENDLQHNVRLDTNAVEDTDWWVQEIDRKWLEANPRAEGWAIYFEAAKGARYRLSQENHYVTSDDDLKWFEVGGGDKVQIIMEDMDNA